MEIIEVRAIGIVRDNRAFIAYQVDYWLVAGNALIRRTISGEIALTL